VNVANSAFSPPEHQRWLSNRPPNRNGDRLATPCEVLSRHEQLREQLKAAWGSMIPTRNCRRAATG